MTMKEIAGSGFSRMAVKRLADSGDIERSVRGVYRIPAAGDEDVRALWASVTRARPDAVFCMVSAAAFHGLTQNMAGVLNVALPTRRRVPAEGSMGVAACYVQWSSPEAFTLGVDRIEIDGVEVAVTGPERTVVDLFRFSSLVPQRREPRIYADPETVHDALTRYLHGESAGSPLALMRMAKKFGVWDRMKPVIDMLNLSYASGPGL